MLKIRDFFINCIKFLSGVILLVLVIFFWAIALFLTSLIEIITWIELRLTRMMKKCFSDELKKP